MDEHKRWEEKTCTTCLSEKVPDLEIVKTIYQQEFVVRIEEILPIAYLDVLQDSIFANRTSPYKVTLTARNTKSGSFPIERIDWDLGDGTPIKIQRRWAINNDPAFSYTGVFVKDWRDPRNFDITHTYYVSPNTGLTFYPSITCYSSSTASSDCAKSIVGPIKPSPTNRENTENKPIKILQNEITDEGNIILADVNCTAVVWKHK